MCPERRAESGFTLVAALFLLVVLAGLAAVAVKLTGIQHQTINLAMLSARAYHAAVSAADFGSYRALSAGVCSATTLNFTEGALAGFSADVSCTGSAHAEGGVVTTVYIIEAFARGGVYGTPDYVSRRIRTTVTDAG